VNLVSFRVNLVSFRVTLVSFRVNLVFHSEKFELRYFIEFEQRFTLKLVRDRCELF
jgi:hypothetical protein